MEKQVVVNEKLLVDCHCMTTRAYTDSDMESKLDGMLA
jgi:hypothetical protein